MKMISTSEISNRPVITCIQDFNKITQGINFKQNRHRDWNKLVSIEQEENKHKNEFNR